MRLSVLAAPVAAILLSASAALAAQSFIIADDNTGHILASGSPNEKLQIGSLTKIATAMVVMDWAAATGSSLASEAIVPQGVATVGGVNPCGLQPGDRVSLRDLLYAAMMVSDNCAAYTLASHVGAKLPNASGLGPVDNFTAHMNALARKLLMKRTLFLNPHGIDSTEPLPYSTAADLARLIRYAYSHAGFGFYVSQPTREISIIGPGGVARGFALQNTNELLGQDDIDGVKTGRTARAGDCVALSADREPQAVPAANGGQVAIPRRIIVVVLNSSNRFGEGLEAVRYGWRLHDKWSGEGRPVSKRTTL